jgi:hypothetical protein
LNESAAVTIVSRLIVRLGSGCVASKLLPIKVRECGERVLGDFVPSGQSRRYDLRDALVSARVDGEWIFSRAKVPVAVVRRDHWWEVHIYWEKKGIKYEKLGLRGLATPSYQKLKKLRPHLGVGISIRDQDEGTYIRIRFPKQTTGSGGQAALH